MPRDAVLNRVRLALGNPDKPPAAPPVRFDKKSFDDPVGVFLDTLNRLVVNTYRAPSAAEARNYAARVIAGRATVAADSPYLASLGIPTIPGVEIARGEARELCATAAVGITSAEYGLADTGTMVMMSSPEQPRLVSLLPPVHLAIMPASRVLSGIDEFLEMVPKPMENSSSLVFITGGSRTADIEMILVRGVHGPGEVHVVVVEEGQK